MPTSAAHTPLPPYARQLEPPPPQQQPEMRPLGNNPMPSPGGQYPRTPYEHHVSVAPSIAVGTPAPSAAPTAADAAQREREDRPGSTAPPKRLREWEDDSTGSQKKVATEESRSRLDEIKMQRTSPREKMATPPVRSPSEVRRMDEQRPTSAYAYHPSEAAHHPQSLPSMQSITQPSPRASVQPQEDHRAPPPPPQPAPVYEPAARKMDVDENYDDSGDDKSATKQESRRNSPKAVNGGGNSMAVAVDGQA